MLKIENLHYTYEDGTPALNGIDLEIAQGEFLAILGSNGSGKTTLIKHLNGLLHPTLGRVLLDGNPIERVEERDVFSRIGIVFQDPNDQLFASTVEEDVAFGPTNMGLAPQEIKERVHKSLHQVGMQDYARKGIHALSHGQKKRICIAGILAMEPQVIILDEPTAGLDPIGAAAFDNLIRDLQQSLNLTVFMVTHDLDSLAAICDRIAVLIDKKIVVDTMENLMQLDHPWIQEYFHGPRARAALER